MENAFYMFGKNFFQKKKKRKNGRCEQAHELLPSTDHLVLGGVKKMYFFGYYKLNIYQVDVIKRKRFD